MGLLGDIFGTKEALSSVSNHIDKIFFTKEEKATKWIDTLKAYEPFKLAQRLVAATVVGSYVSSFLLYCVLEIASIWINVAETVASRVIESANETLGTAFLMIIGFYFAGGMAEGIIKQTRNKK